ncbi:MAG: restriction endonuclease subunit S [Deltaproteobacteria bacterium]|nr:restriction endonuclease subunit S [Deltaproteobacteria bacterium]
MSREGWRTYKLNEFAEVQNGYAFKSDDFVKKGIPVIKIKNLVSPNVTFEDVQYFNGKTNDKLKPFFIRKNDILISMTGSHLNQLASAVGKIARYQFDYPALLNQRVGKIYVKDRSICDEGYLFYFLNRIETQIELASTAGGSANQANISPSQIKNLSLLLPPLPTQRRIADILSAMDNKIELNRQTNATLEAIAQTIFKEWFVDFNFPGATGEMVESELDMIPRGWRVLPLDEIANFLNGLALQKYPRGNDHDYLPAIKIRELKNGVTDSSDRVSRNIPEKYIIQDGDLIFSWSGTLEVKFWVGGEGALNQHLFKVTSKEYPLWFCYFWILHHLEEFRNIAKDKTTTMGHIQRTHLSTALCLVPDNLNQINKMIHPIIEKAINNEKEMLSLAQTRDNLLPKLMSGEIEV